MSILPETGFKFEIEGGHLFLFDGWTRAVTDTEYVAERIRNSDVISVCKPSEYSSVYRVQPKVTGCERRSALCYLNRHAGCEDIDGRLGVHFYAGIDLLDSVSDLAKAGSITIKSVHSDNYLQVYVTPALNHPIDK